MFVEWMSEWIYDLMNEWFLPIYHPLCFLSKMSVNFPVHCFEGYLSAEEKGEAQELMEHIRLSKQNLP